MEGHIYMDIYIYIYISYISIYLSIERGRDMRYLSLANPELLVSSRTSYGFYPLTTFISPPFCVLNAPQVTTDCRHEEAK